MNQDQSFPIKKTNLSYDKEIGKVVISIKIDSKEEDLNKYQFQVTKIQLKCKSSVYKMILHNFLQIYSDQNCHKAPQQVINIKVIRRYSSIQNQNQSSRKGQVVEIECQGQDHMFYLSSLIRSTWQKKIDTTQLNVQDIVDCCLFYMQQFQLDIEDLIQVFQAPLTQQYGRL